MTVLEAIQSVTLEIGVAYPDQVFGQTTRTARELQHLANKAAKMIAFDSGHDWTAMTATATISGNGASQGFGFPDDYQRMLKKARLWPSASPNSPLKHYTDLDAWLGMLTQSYSSVVGAWTILDNTVQIRMGGNNAALPSGQNIKYMYLQNTPVLTAAGAQATKFTADTDTFVLDQDLLELAMVYRWKQSKNQDYSEEMSDYENRLAERIGADKGSKLIVTGDVRTPLGAEFAFPGVIVP